MQKESQMYKITPADRLASVSEYYFSKKLKEVAQMNAEGKDVISLGIGSPDMPPSEKTIETLCSNAHDPNGHGYQPYVGIPELRKGFAAWYQRWYGVELNPNTEIQPLIGSKEGILHVTLAFVNPGEQVLVPNPGYPTYTSLSKILGAEVINYDLKEDENWMPDFEALERTDLSRVKLMWTNYPNMPTGANATPELYGRLVDFARRKNIVIVYPERETDQYSERTRGQRLLYRIQLHEQKPQYAGMAYRYAGLKCGVCTMDPEGEKQYRQRNVPCHATGGSHCSGS